MWKSPDIATSDATVDDGNRLPLSGTSTEHTEFDTAFQMLPEGYSEGTYEGRRFSLIVRRSQDGRRNSLFAKELAGTDIVSFNLYRFTSGKTSLKPCEMSARKVVAFVLDVQPDA